MLCYVMCEKKKNVDNKKKVACLYNKKIVNFAQNKFDLKFIWKCSHVQ